MIFNNEPMRKALEQAFNAFSLGEVPVGAVIVERASKEIIALGYNIVEESNNATKHAELVAIERACNILRNKNLKPYDMYVTLEPCSMCAAAISYSRIGRLFYGAVDPKQGAVESNFRYFTQSACLHRPEIYSGILAEESSALLREFFQNLRI